MDAPSLAQWRGETRYENTACLIDRTLLEKWIGYCAKVEPQIENRERYVELRNIFPKGYTEHCEPIKRAMRFLSYREDNVFITIGIKSKSAKDF